MRTTRVFKSGNSQAVRLPVDFQFNVNEVEILKRDNEIIIREKPSDLTLAFELLSSLGDDLFPDGRQDELPQERDFE